MFKINVLQFGPIVFEVDLSVYWYVECLKIFDFFPLRIGRVPGQVYIVMTSSFPQNSTFEQVLADFGLVINFKIGITPLKPDEYC